MSNWLFLADIAALMLAFVAFVLVAFAAMLLLLAKQYKRCPSNRILVIYGRTASRFDQLKLVHGGAVFVVPLLQDFAFLSLEPIRLDVSLPAHLQSRQLAFTIPRKYTVAIGTTSELMRNAAERLLNLSESEIKQHGKELILDAISEFVEATGDNPDSAE